MKNRLWLPVAAAVLTAGAAAAQRPLVPGEVVRGSLSSGDPRLDNGTYYDEYAFEARRGETVIIRMESEAFDTYLHLGTAWREGSWRALASDDDGGGGTDSRIRFIAPEDGIYVVRATSLRRDTGPYELTLQGGRAPGAGYGSGRPGQAGGGRGGGLRPGEPVVGSLTGSDPRLEAGEPYHLYTYRGRRGERLTLTLRSDDFDAYLVLGRPGGRHGVSTALARNDDDGGGTDAFVDFTLPADDEYVVRVNGMLGGTGAYELEVESSLGGYGRGRGRDDRYPDNRDDRYEDNRYPNERDRDDRYQDDRYPDDRDRNDGYEDGRYDDRDRFGDETVDVDLVGRWRLMGGGSSTTGTAPMGTLTIEEDGSYAWLRAGRVLRGQLAPYSPRRAPRNDDVRYYALDDGREEFYLFLTLSRGVPTLQLVRRGSDTPAASGRLIQ